MILTIDYSKYITLLTAVLASIIVYFQFSEYIGKFFKVFRKQKAHEQKICRKIIEWWNFVDKNLTDNGINLDEVHLLEKEIDFMFQINKKTFVMLDFDANFRNEFLKFCGIQKKYRTKEMFIKFAYIRSKNLELVFGLSKSIHKKEINHFNLPLQDYWNIMRGNFHQFYQQYIFNWNNLPVDELKLTIADIEMPIKVLRMYFKEY